MQITLRCLHSIRKMVAKKPRDRNTDVFLSFLQVVFLLTCLDYDFFSSVPSKMVFFYLKRTWVLYKFTVRVKV